MRPVASPPQRYAGSIRAKTSPGTASIITSYPVARSRYPWYDVRTRGCTYASLGIEAVSPRCNASWKSKVLTDLQTGRSWVEDELPVFYQQCPVKLLFFIGILIISFLKGKQILVVIYKKIAKVNL